MRNPSLPTYAPETTTLGDVLPERADPLPLLPSGVADRPAVDDRVLPAATPAPWNTAEVVALIAVAAVSVAAFSWSAIALHGVAVAAGIESRLAWGAPVIVDGPIIQSAFALVALNRRERMGVPIPRKTRRFFWWELALAELISLVGNGVHAWMSDNLALPQLAAAAVAGAAPVAALAVTHALTELMEVGHVEAAQTLDTPARVTEGATPVNTSVAARNSMTTAGNTSTDSGSGAGSAGNSHPVGGGNTGAVEGNGETQAERDARLVAMRDSGMSYRQIGEEVGLDPGYICRRVKRARAESEPSSPEETEEEEGLHLVS